MNERNEDGDQTSGIVTRIEALGYRSLRDVSQTLGPFQVLVGANASGKSSFLDVVAPSSGTFSAGVSRLPSKAIRG